MTDANDSSGELKQSTDHAPATSVEHLKQQGWCLVEGVLSREEATHALSQLWSAADEYRKRGNDTHIQGLDPNTANVRVFDLLALNRFFWTLIQRPIALDLARSLLGNDILVSNFTANIAKPGSGSMSLHSDQSFVAPEPWLEPWSMNIIWCLTDVKFENGATLYIPDSHKVTRREELGEQPMSRLRPFEAPAGSIIAMDGRVWHTSGSNITENEDRAMLFGYYTRGFLRQQCNWNAVIPLEMQQEMNPDLRTLVGLDAYPSNSLAAEILTADYT